MKKQEQFDEERRIKRVELRMSGQCVELRNSHDVPFGVRAIQSGIQIDGIWISKDNTPVPSELRLGRLRGISTDLNAAFNSAASERSSVISSQVARTASSRGRPSFRHNDSAHLALDQSAGSEYATVAETPDGPGHRPSYKPRRSSHLRYGSYGEYEEEVMAQFEGKPQHNEKGHFQRPRSSSQICKEMRGIMADIEHSSGASSDDAYGTLCNYLRAQPDRPRMSLPPRFPIQSLSAAAPTHTLAGKSSRASFPPVSSKTEYFSTPLESPDADESDPIHAPQITPAEAPSPFGLSHVLNVQDLTESRESQVPLLSQPRSPTSFVPGELHVNKSARRVNSGFEILPAGTFGFSPEINWSGMSFDERRDQEDESGERRQSKLQKKPRVSMRSTRLSASIHGS